MARTNADGFMNVVLLATKDVKKFAKGEKVETFSIAGKALEEGKLDTSSANQKPKKVAKKLHNVAVSLLDAARNSERGVVTMPFEKFGTLQAMLEAYGLTIGIEIRDANWTPDVVDEDDDIEL